MSHEAEMPGKEVSRDQFRVICARYYFASKFISGRNVLEVGCGPGLGLGYLVKYAKKIVGIDISEENLNYAKFYYQEKDHNGKIEIHQMDAHNLSLFGEKSFDVVLTMATVYALQLDKFLKECYRALRDDGKLIFCLPNKDVPSFLPAKMSTKYYSVPQLFEILNKYKFSPKIFAAFPVTTQFTITRGLSRIINLIMGGIIIKKFLNRFILQKLVLKPEITEEDMEFVKDIQFVPLNPDLVNSQYRILYVVAEKRFT